MEERGTTIALLLLLLVWCVMGAWDGLKKRNIRLILHGRFDLNICWSGLPTLVVGAVCAFFAFVFGQVLVNGLIGLANTCHQDMNCTLQVAILPLFTYWVSIVLLLMAVGCLGLWLLTSFSQPGAYRRSFLAPGVWYSETELMVEIQADIESHHRANVDRNTMLWVANWVRYELYPYGAFSRGLYTATTYKEWADKLNKKQHVLQGFDGNKTALRKAIQLTVEYYAQRNEEANRVWPWRKHLGW